MIERVEITVLVENTAGGMSLLAEHGLALWMDLDGRKLLFDTGQGMVLERNAAVLGIDLSAAEMLVLSHGHYDHTGGLARTLARFRDTTVYMHPAALEPKYGRDAGGVGRYIGAPRRELADLESQVREVVLTKTPTTLLEGVWATGEVPRATDFEDTGGPFYLDEACTQPDLLLDDQALYIESAQGLVVVLGCAHSGVVNILEHVVSLTGREQVFAVLGGMHLVRASEERVTRSLEALARREVRVMAPAHCTGRAAMMRLWQRFPDRYRDCVTGTRFVFE